MKLIKCLFSSIFFIYCSASLQAAEIHAILVADTMDGVIHFQTNIDMMQRAAKRIAAKTGYDLHVAMFEEQEVRISNIIEYIEKLDVQQEDVLFFYINNHGSRTENKNSQWPTLSFCIEKALHPEQYELDFAILNEALKNKNAHLLISMAEACNVISSNDDFFKKDEKDDEDDEDDEGAGTEAEFEYWRATIEQEKGPTHEYRLAQGDRLLQRLKERTDDDILELYRRLFVEPYGTVLISSSSPGEAARHGLFTPLFLDYFCTSTFFFADIETKSNPWKTILDKTKHAVQKRWEQEAMEGKQKTQTVQYELQLNYKNGTCHHLPSYYEL